MDNVVPLFGRKKPEQTKVTLPISGPINALVEWAESNGIDVLNDVRFQVRLTDFVSLLRNAVNETMENDIAVAV